MAARDDMMQRALLDEDLGEMTIEDVECKNCRMLCSDKHPLMYWGRPLMICTKTERGLSALMARTERLKDAGLM